MTAADNGSAPGLFPAGRRSRYERLREALRAGELPLGEAMHPVALAAVLVLVLNDWVLKPGLGAGPISGLITGKLSDLAGLAAAPVVLTATIGLGLCVARALGASVDPYLTRRRLGLAIAATGGGFAAIKLSATAASWFTAAIGVVRPATVILDPTDLLCLPALAVAWWIGRDELRRLGRARRR